MIKIIQKNKRTFSLTRQLKSFSYAFKGIVYVFWKEPNMHIHLLATIGVIGLAWYLEVALWEWGLLILAIGLVLVAEMLNTSIELLVDLVSPEYNELAGKVKDVAAGGVTLAAVAAVGVGGVVFLSRLF